MKRLRRYRASDRLLTAVVAQPQPQAEKARTPADVVKLRERFEEAVAALKQQRRIGTQPYDLPVVRHHRRARLRQDDGAAQFGPEVPARAARRQRRAARRRRHAQLRLVVHRRGGVPRHRRPLHDAGLRRDVRQRRLGGVSRAAAQVSRAPSAQRRHPDDQRAGPADAGSRRRAKRTSKRRAGGSTELNRELRIQLPVYVMVTKCDLVAGFTEYFDDLTQEGRAQVWGVTFPYEQTLANERPTVVPGGVRRADDAAERARVRPARGGARRAAPRARSSRSRSRWRRCAIR